jgi:hypothetical protein
MLLARLWHDKRHEGNAIWHRKWHKKHDCADDQHVTLGLISTMMLPAVEDCLIWVSNKLLSIMFSIMMTKHFLWVFRSPNVKILL